jgi:hypothetical protein
VAFTAAFTNHRIDNSPAKKPINQPGRLEQLSEHNHEQSVCGTIWLGNEKHRRKYILCARKNGNNGSAADNTYLLSLEFTLHIPTVTTV